jgi:hypothetical protein
MGFFSFPSLNLNPQLLALLLTASQSQLVLGYS